MGRMASASTGEKFGKYQQNVKFTIIFLNSEKCEIMESRNQNLKKNCETPEKQEMKRKSSQFLKKLEMS